MVQLWHLWSPISFRRSERQDLSQGFVLSCGFDDEWKLITSGSTFSEEYQVKFAQVKWYVQSIQYLHHDY